MSSDDKKINAVFILEVLGRPKEFLVETLEDLIKKIDEERGVKVKNKKINEPVLIKDQKDFYTSFAEIEVETGSLMQVMILVFKYMPAHVEITSPQNVTLTNTDFDDVLNELTMRLHGYEELARIMQNEKTILENKLREVINIKKESKVDEENKKQKGKKK